MSIAKCDESRTGHAGEQHADGEGDGVPVAPFRLAKPDVIAESVACSIHVTSPPGAYLATLRREATGAAADNVRLGFSTQDWRLVR